MMWVYVQSANFNINCSALYWAYSSSVANRSLNIHMPYQSTVIWDAVYTGATQNRGSTAMSYGNDSRWTLWCFTKDARAGSMKIYQNGVLVDYKPNMIGQFSTFDLNPSANGDQGNLVIGYGPNVGGMIGAIDEIAIFDADLSVDPLSGAGSTAMGSVAPRFLDMYNMGIN